MTVPGLRPVLVLLAPALLLGARVSPDPASPQEPPARQAPAPEEEALPVEYLEIVTPDVDATCSALAALHGVRFGEPVPAFGHARTAALRGGGRIGVRAPMRADEAPVVRPYALVDDIDAAVEAARAAGAELAMLPTELPGHGRFAIYLLGGIQHGLWEL